MSTVSASQVKALRERTGAGMLDCQKALIENNGDIEAAVDFLRKKGLAAAAKKAGRVASEGLVAVAVEGMKGAVVEVNSETDFVARNDKFQALVKNISSTALNNTTLEALKAAKTASGKTVEEEITENVAVIGEHMTLRRVASLQVEDGVIASYIHNAVVPGMGKIAVLIALESTGDKAKLAEIGKQIAMHAAAARPQALSVEDLDPSLIEREKEVIREQSKASGRPADVIEKMIEGRIRKFYEEVVLLNQLFVIDGKTKISDVVAGAASQVGAPVKLKGFVRFELGEGIENEKSDFASEVAAMSQR
ncbi:MAG: elongation factor Ts [Rickettsiaceae bacterium]|jgi:elongation factor Ts|nr:elongation factor Ts [Rickettsiaceae bacterium]